MDERRFILPDSRGEILLEATVLEHIYRYAQCGPWQREAGGQLFSPTPEQATVRISLGTGPYKEDRSTRCGFVPNLRTATQDRHTQFALGRHAVGLWHTHPEACPMPSEQDRETAQAYLKAFDGAMEGFILLILGNRGNPLNMTLWMASIRLGHSWVQLTEA
ncbi:Mov34/MPN/PAD-1 family protein [Dechloromonas hortensis]|uniref:Mov34/MPN/PAD-1 family protein n=1 Tax=Dechloromonas hortensis TaxID=337779 RepID=UPI001478D072